MIRKHLFADKNLGGVDLTVRYQKTRPPAIVEQSIDIPVGKVSIFIGSNGSGKSTLLKALARQLVPESGVVILDGRDIATMSVHDISLRLGILFQENSAPNDLTVEELAYHGRYPHRRLFESLTLEDRVAVEEALELCGVTALRDRSIRHLSSGQRQLAWIAMLLAQSPHYLFLDEPTTFLDLAHQFDVMNLVRRLNRELGKTVVISMHDLNLAARYADAVFAVRDGKIVAAGSAEEVLTVETLGTVFDVEAKVLRDKDTGALHCVPIGRRASSAKGHR